MGRGFLSAMGLEETPNPQHCVHYHVEKPQDRQPEFSAAVPGRDRLAQLLFETARVTVQIPLSVFINAHDFHKESLATLTRRQILHTEGLVIGQGRTPEDRSEDRAFRARVIDLDNNIPRRVRVLFQCLPQAHCQPPLLLAWLPRRFKDRGYAAAAVRLSCRCSAGLSLPSPGPHPLARRI